MKIKLETLSWQKDYKTKEEYAAAIKENMDIELDVDKIEDNPGERAVVKISSNSLWGKFGQRLNVTQTEYVTDPSKFYRVLLDDRLDKTNITLNNLKDRMCLLPPLQHPILDSGCMVYRTDSDYDTDSVVYVDNGTNTVETGSMLGEWSDELGKDVHINDWISTGLKSYQSTEKGEESKPVPPVVKGFTLSHKNSEKLNLKPIKRC